MPNKGGKPTTNRQRDVIREGVRGTGIMSAMTDPPSRSPSLIESLNNYPELPINSSIEQHWLYTEGQQGPNNMFWTQTSVD